MSHWNRDHHPPPRPQPESLESEPHDHLIHPIFVSQPPRPPRSTEHAPNLSSMPLPTPPPALPVSCLTLVPQNRVFSLNSLCGCCSEPEPEGAFQNISSISPPLKTQQRSFLSASETKPQTFPRGARAFPVPHLSVDFYPITRLCPFPHAALTRKDNFLPFFFPFSSANSSRPLRTDPSPLGGLYSHRLLGRLPSSSCVAVASWAHHSHYTLDLILQSCSWDCCTDTALSSRHEKTETKTLV